jgi:hypothetical protein
MPSGNSTPRDGSSPYNSSRSPPSEIIVNRIADVNDCDPTEIPPLYEAIDPDALDSLFLHSSPAVQFEYAGHQVTITPNEVILVDDNE